MSVNFEFWEKGLVRGGSYFYGFIRGRGWIYVGWEEEVVGNDFYF